MSSAREYVHCDLCGSNDFKVRYRKPDNWLWLDPFEYPVVECLACGLVYVNPRPTEEGMTCFYPNHFYDDRDTRKHQRRYERQLRYLRPLGHEKVLDIGCGRGDFLLFLKKRFPHIETYGCDPYVDDVRSRDIVFSRVSLPECHYPSTFFDVVTAWAVFEHLHHPGQYFAEVSRIVKPGGAFVFLVTNAESLYGRRAYKEDVPRHLYHFSKKTLQSYADRCGFHMADLIYTDDIFDGRGRGTFHFLLSDFVGITWKHRQSKEVPLLKRLAGWLGSLLDLLIFLPHWERRLGCSGIMIARYEKKPEE